MRNRLALTLALVLLGTVAQAQEFWEKKEPQRWSEGDCKKLLQDSPWAKTHEQASLSMNSLETRANRQDDNVTKAGYHVQVRSARPVREAMIQRAKLHSKYDQLSAEQKQAMDGRAAEFLSKQLADVIVIGVEYYAESDAYDRAMATYWQQQSLELIKNTTHLLVGGKRIQPQQFFVAPGKNREFELIFPRVVDGKPVVGPNDKSFAIEFDYPPVTDQSLSGTGRRTSSAANTSLTSGHAFVEFNLKKMTTSKGEVIF